MSEHEKIPAQGGEMPPVERAADTEGRCIDTVRGATSAGNAAQQRAIPWAHTRSGAVRRGIDASKMARRDYGLTDDDSGRHDFDAGFRYGTKYGHFTSARAAGAQAAMITSLECAAQWLEHGKDPKAAAAEIRACLAKLDATPAAPVAELVPDPLSRRVERLLVELHAEGRLSEGQCAKMLNISRVDWRELAEFLAPATQAVAADGAAQDFPAGAIFNGRVFADRLEQYPFESQGGDLRLCVDWVEFRRCFEHLAEWIEGRAAVSPATADSNCTCGMKLGHARHCAAFDESMVRYEPFGEKTATADERAAFDEGLNRDAIRERVLGRILSKPERNDSPDVIGAAHLDPDTTVEVTTDTSSPSYMVGWKKGWQAARASQAAAPAAVVLTWPEIHALNDAVKMLPSHPSLRAFRDRLFGTGWGDAKSAAAPASPDWRHIANEWADVATNGIQAVKNVRDGIDTADDAIARLKVDIERCRELPAQAAAPADAISLLRKAHRTLACAALTQIRDGEAVWAEIGRFLDASPAEAREPVATLHDDGHYAWNPNVPKPEGYDRAGWRMAVYDVPADAGEAVFADDDERSEFEKACFDFKEDGETDVDYGLLMKWANAGLLQCDNFQITAAGNAALAQGAQGGKGGDRG